MTIGLLVNLRSAAYSPYFKKIVGIAMMKMDYCKIKEHFNMKIVNKSINGEICNLPINLNYEKSKNIHPI